MSSSSSSSSLKLRVIVDAAMHGARAPQRQSEHAAGYDLYAGSDEDGRGVTISPGETKLVPLGIRVAVPHGYYGQIQDRSSIASKQSVHTVAGVIDSDYRGPVFVAMHNSSTKPWTATPGDRVAQLVVLPVLQVEVETCTTLDDTVRGDGGFGSTGTR
jgi:dUTP pyrophosphatase